MRFTTFIWNVFGTIFNKHQGQITYVCTQYDISSYDSSVTMSCCLQQINTKANEANRICKISIPSTLLIIPCYRHF
jgi:hypothetical protein